MFKQLKQDKKVKEKTFKQMNASKLNDVETHMNQNEDNEDKLCYHKPKPVKKPPSDDEIFGDTPYKGKKKSKKLKTKKVSGLGKTLYKKIKF